MTGMFDSTEEEMAEEQRSRVVGAADYSFVTIPKEVFDAWRNLHTAEATAARLRRYTRMTASMKYDWKKALALRSESHRILGRFFSTAQTDSRSGINSDKGQPE